MCQQKLDENNLLFALLCDAATCLPPPSPWAFVQWDKWQWLSTPFYCSVWYCIINKPFSLFVYALMCLSKLKLKDTDVCQVTKKWKMCC